MARQGAEFGESTGWLSAGCDKKRKNREKPVSRDFAFFDANSSLPNFFSTLFLVYVSFFSFRDEFYDILRELLVVGTKYEPKSPNCQIRDWRTSYTSLSKTWLALYGVGKLKHQ